MSTRTSKFQNVRVEAKEIGEILIDMRGACKTQGLQKTENALQSALHVLFYEMRVNSGQLVLPKQNSKGDFIAREP